MSGEGVVRKVVKITRVGSAHPVPLWMLTFECEHAIYVRGEKQPERTHGTCTSCGPVKSEVIVVVDAQPDPSPPGVA